MQRRRFLNLAVTAATSLALAGCGFSLRGFDSAGPFLGELAVSGADSELTRLTTERLTAVGTQVHADAPLVLNLGPETFRERQLGSLDSGPRELEMALAVPFSVQRRSDGAYRLAEQTIEVTTRFSVSDANLLAQDDLREEARHELRQQAVRRLLDRLNSLGDSRP